MGELTAGLTSLRSETMMRALTLLATLVIAGTTQLPAQAAPAGDSVASADLADQIRGQARIRVQLVNHTELELLEPRLVEGSLRFVRFEPGGQAATQSSNDGTHVLPLVEVGRIQVRRTAAGKGALIGLLVGGATLAAIDRAGSPPRWDRNETLLFGFLGGGVGALVGAVIGAPFRSWKTVYPAPASRTR